MTNGSAVLTLAIVALTALPVSAQETKRQLDAHVHGHGKVNIAIEKGTLALEFEAPSADIVGFEYEAKTSEDKAKIEATRKTLKDGAALFVVNTEADCRLVKAEVEQHCDAHDHDEGQGHDEKEGHSGHKPGKHAHSDKEHGKADGHDHHAEYGDHGHDHKHGADEAGHEAAHSEFHASYNFECANRESLKTINFAFFSKFPNSKELEVTVVGDSGQSAFEVTPAQPEISLDGIV